MLFEVYASKVVARNKEEFDQTSVAIDACIFNYYSLDSVFLTAP